ncbi:hypothetical protein SAMD00019534_056160 [Acytostelium subglobosum LB1]|uniref:hypothetical protein n=1 Tax=Acytostelium subglobosum LB1 TaxID=1410327 RepID=UPI000644FA69|nr:hypothetical protein SAMD00019534_056160 [Acytostelium subglobosum LB1]GAM22441.1 hypothetical protein SAMD00019534_056160 [Acytostelium subglobosum LB1]|eukprot:XP_012754561.1 hypothetical protein SAMD00019534_056160 [Acytostelium subglobosum LB1]
MSTVQTPVHNVPDHGNSFIYRIDGANFRPNPTIEQGVFKGTRLIPEKDSLTNCHGTILSSKPALNIKFAKKCCVRVRVYRQYSKSDNYKLRVQYEKPNEDHGILGLISIAPKGEVVDTIQEVLNSTTFTPEFYDSDSVVSGFTTLKKLTNVTEIYLTLSIEKEPSVNLTIGNINIGLPLTGAPTEPEIKGVIKFVELIITKN